MPLDLPYLYHPDNVAGPSQAPTPLLQPSHYRRETQPRPPAIESTKEKPPTRLILHVKQAVTKLVNYNTTAPADKVLHTDQLASILKKALQEIEPSQSQSAHTTTTTPTEESRASSKEAITKIADATSTDIEIIGDLIDLRQIRSEVRAIRKYQENSDKHFTRLGNTIACLKSTVELLIKKNCAAQLETQIKLSDKIKNLVETQQDHFNLMSGNLADLAIPVAEVNDKLATMVNRVNQAELRPGNLAVEEIPEVIDVADSPLPEEDHRDEEEDSPVEPEAHEEDDTVQLYADPIEKAEVDALLFSDSDDELF